MSSNNTNNIINDRRPVFRLAYANTTGNFDPCIFEVKYLPSPTCQKPGFEVEAVLLLLRLVMREKVRLKVYQSPDTGYDGIGENVSVLAMIRDGRADVTITYYDMTYFRFEIPNVGALFSVRNAFLYKTFEQEPELPALALIQNPSGLWTLLALCVGSWSLMKNGTGKVLKKLNVRKRKKFLKWRRRFKTLIGFWTGLVLSTIGSYIIFVFVRKPVQSVPFYNLESLTRKLATGEYRAVFKYQLVKEYFYKISALQKTEKWNPPLVLHREDIVEAAALINRDRRLSRPKHVLIVSEDLIAQIFTNFCNFEAVIDETLPSKYTTMYHREGLENISMRSEMKDVYQDVFRRLENRYLPKKHCGNEEKSPSKYSTYLLRIEQIQGVFFIGGIALASTAGVLLFEMGYHTGLIWLKKFSNLMTPLTHTSLPKTERPSLTPLDVKS